MEGMDMRSEGTSSLAYSIKAKLASLSSLSSKCCIYKVPNTLRRLNPDAYSPRVVSIGPFHHGKEELQDMEEHKYRYLQTFLPRIGFSLEHLVGVARTWEENARSCYAEDVELNSDEFVKMLVVDGSFLVELMLRLRYPHLIGENDRIFGKSWMIYGVYRDMVLIENQLPFFVVKSLFDLLSVDNQQETDSVIQIIYHFFRRFINNIAAANFKPEPDHFVDVLRSFYLPEFPMEMEETTFKVFDAPEATELLNAGVTLKPAETSSCLLDFKFDDGVLEIPTISIHDYTEHLYRNIIVFEQCHCFDKIFLNYITLLSSFIRSSSGADLLIRSKIIVNYLGNAEDVSKLFNNMCQEVITTRHHFQSLSENLHAYCNTPWNRWKAVLRRDYFQNPWAVASVLAAVLLLILTFIQTICSLFPYLSSFI